MRPLISICIPTYNRAEILQKSLESYVNNEHFCSEFEIVISDNASTDNTQYIGELYAAKYNNIKYFRNVENIRDKNFSLSLDRATGEYLKLMKDNVIIVGNGLKYLIDTVKSYQTTRKSLFFTNGFLYNSCKTDCYECHNFEEFIVHSSFRVTAITFFGCWREQWNKVIGRDKYSRLQLAQDDWVYQIITQSPNSLLYTKKYFSTDEVGIRKGYNWFEVHVDNYYKIMQPYIERGLISEKSLKREKETYLKGLKLPILHKYMWKVLSTWEFDMSCSTEILRNNFGNIPYYYCLMATLPIWGVYEGIKYKIKVLMIKLGIKDLVYRIRQ